jgi:CheY-like chemotaxis protein
MSRPARVEGRQMVSVPFFDSEPTAALRILVVEDDDDSRELMATLLAEKGTHGVTEARSGEEGLDRLRRNAYDLVVTDIGLPNIHGLEMLDTAKAEGLLGQAIVVVCTANEGVGASVARRGAILLPKPVDVNALASVLRGAERRH